MTTHSPGRCSELPNAERNNASHLHVNVHTTQRSNTASDCRLNHTCIQTSHDRPMIDGTRSRIEQTLLQHRFTADMHLMRQVLKTDWSINYPAQFTIKRQAFGAQTGIHNATQQTAGSIDDQSSTSYIKMLLILADCDSKTCHFFC